MSTDLCLYLIHVVGVYYGREKPTCVELLRDFVNELGPILEHGYTFADGTHSIISLDYFVCDLPALALVKFFKGATSYSACPKCTVFGEYYKSGISFIPHIHDMDVLQRARDKNAARRVLFECDGEIVPIPTKAAKKPVNLPTEQVQPRTDRSCRDKTDPEHHIVHKLDPITGVKTLVTLSSPLLELNIDMIENFTIDGMHTVYLGVVKRFLKFLSSASMDEIPVQDELLDDHPPQKRKGKGRKDQAAITNTTFKRIGQIYATSGSKFPREFSRSPRNFEHLDRWKATEYRNFLLYGGDMAIGSPEVGVPTILVIAFRCLVLSIRILSDLTLYKAWHWHTSNLTLVVFNRNLTLNVLKLTQI